MFAELRATAYFEDEGRKRSQLRRAVTSVQHDYNSSSHLPAAPMDRIVFDEKFWDINKREKGKVYLHFTISGLWRWTASNPSLISAVQLFGFLVILGSLNAENYNFVFSDFQKFTVAKL